MSDLLQTTLSFADGSSSQNMMEVLNLTRSLPSVEKKVTRLSESVAQSDESKMRFRVDKNTINSLRSTSR